MAAGLRRGLAAVAAACVLLVSGCAPGLSSSKPPRPTVAKACTDNRISFDTAGWKTDFTRHGVPLCQISSGGPPRDGIPPLDHPKFVTVAYADTWLRPEEPVVDLTLAGVERAYPLQVLIWHEIVNDRVADVPVTVTFCPL